MKFIATGVIISMAITVGARGEVVLDQQHSFTASIANSSDEFSQVGQTFTVGVAGTLDHIDVLMFRLGGFFDPVVDPLLRVFNTDGGLPTGAPLAAVTVPKANVPLNNAAFVSFGLSSAAIEVDIGEVLAFSIGEAGGTGTYFLLTDQGQPIEYPGGAAIRKFSPNPWQQISPPQDHGFRTFVIADEVDELLGDYNDDDVIDAADYVVWRKNETANNPLPNDDGLATQAERFNLWRANFGNIAMGSGAGNNTGAVPEPATAVLLMLMTLNWCLRQRRTA